jgi:hypothetical protein
LLILSGTALGSPKTTREILLKTCKKPKRNTSHLSAHTGHSPHYGGPRGPPELPTQRPPRAGSASLEGSRLPRAGSASLEGSWPPRAGSASLEGSPPPRSRLPHTHARSRTAGRRHHAPRNHAPALLRQLPRGNPSPPLWGTVRHGQCQLRGTVPPIPVRLTRRALEGGPATPSNCFLVNLQGKTMTLGRWDAIPATVGPVRPTPCLQHHAGHCCNNSSAVGHAGTGHRHACHCIPYGSPSTASSSLTEDATADYYALTLEAATVRVQDRP